MNIIIARIALPIVSAGILSGAALGLAGMASAEVTTTQRRGSHTSIVVTPDTYAKPATHRDAGLALPPRPRPRLPRPVDPQLNNNTNNN